MPGRSRTLVLPWRPRRVPLYFSTAPMRLTSLFKKLVRLDILGLFVLFVVGAGSRLLASDKN